MQNRLRLIEYDLDGEVCIVVIQELAVKPEFTAVINEDTGLCLTQELWIILIKFWDISNQTKTPRNFALLHLWGPLLFLILYGIKKIVAWILMKLIWPKKCF